MKQLLILSGKGGTGKTTVASSFINLSNGICFAFADCDVDEPNLHLVFSDGKPLMNQEFKGFKKAVINQILCRQCDACEKHCRQGAIKNRVVNIYLCEGCGVCELVCPSSLGGVKAIKLVDFPSGNQSVSQTSLGIFSTAQLKAGARGSGKLVYQVKRNLALYSNNPKLVILDGAPGTGCPVIASISGTSMALLVVEPSLSALSDLKRVLKTIETFDIEITLCINKSDSCLDCTKQIRAFCAENHLPILGEIPCDPLVVKAINHGRSVVEYPDSPAGDAIKQIYYKIIERLQPL